MDEDQFYIEIFRLEALGLVKITRNDKGEMLVSLSDDAKKALDGIWKGDQE
jgi:hypothetical protein